MLLLLSFAGAGCAHGSTPGAKAATTDAKAERLELIEDDYDEALARARAEHKPLVVEAWAPWCHTCQYMRTYVFPDPSLAPVAKRFVWASLDTEKEKNGRVLARYPMESWPTMWVVDSADESVALKWVGSATVPELASLLEDAENAIERGGAGGEAGAALVRANRAAAEGRTDEAIDAYRAALASAPPGWPKRAVAVASLSAPLKKKAPAACVELALAEAPRMPAGTPLVNLLADALDAAAELPKGSTARAGLPALVEQAKRVIADTSLPILADDRSGLYETLVDVLSTEGDQAGAKNTARAWAAFLEEEAARAPTPEARVVFDAHRVSAYLTTGDEPRAIDMLVQSERDFPTDYNPPARLARVYFKLKQYDLALAAIGRALSRVYGPRALRQLELKADILEAMGDRAGAAATLREALDLAARTPLTGSYPKLVEQLRRRLDKTRAN
jgi:tetratricopeptide (TPR) repeat protein